MVPNIRDYCSKNRFQFFYRWSKYTRLQCL